MPGDTAKQSWRRWLPQWAPTLAVLVALLAVVVPATYYLGGMDQRLAGAEAGLARVESRMDAMETRMAALFADIRTELREQRREICRRPRAGSPPSKRWTARMGSGTRGRAPQPKRPDLQQEPRQQN